ncbi:hypothetical protein E8E12_007850 [Didymella heteroderae]|uniref:Uncharacterized protein n=1 Tax=Didymella heteroderae TaxID=1769908 RepID=A0A9P4WZQ7_9PLEO|nr:hypothetical protein E8E12_007850 [Didymella heteroderae]
MARLSQAPDPLYTIPLSSRTPRPVAGDQPNMPSSPKLRPLSVETNLQVHVNDNDRNSPLPRFSGRASLSPADCRTLEKILSDVASPPATPSPLEQSNQLSRDSGLASTVGATEEEDVSHLVRGEATDTGYEDDSMELSEGVENSTGQVVSPLKEPASPSVSEPSRHLQESVSAHDEKEKLRYSSGRHSSTTKRSKTNEPQCERNVTQDATASDTIEDVMNLPGKHAPPARSLDVGQPDSDRQAVPDDIKQLTYMRLSTEKVLAKEQMEQERAEAEKEPGVFISTVSGPQYQTQNHGKFELDGFGADSDQTRPRFCLGISGAPRRKVRKVATGLILSRDAVRLTWKEQFSQDSAPKSPDQYSPVAPRSATETPVQVPSTTTPTPANQTPESAHVQSATYHIVPATPFTKTLGYFKQYKGPGGSLSTRRRNMALPQELTEVAETGTKTNDTQHDTLQPEPQCACALIGTSALKDLEAMVRHNEDIVVDGAPIHQEDDYVQVSVAEGRTADTDGVAAGLPISDDQKQLILYPQHPAIINAIGMIPATMFWVTAAPVVKYTGIALELLIDKLRDTYL